MDEQRPLSRVWRTLRAWIALAPRHGWRPLLIWAVIVVASGIAVAQSNARDQKAQDDQFTLRTTIAGHVLAGYLQNQEMLMRVRAEDLLAGPVVTAQQLALVVSGLGYAGGGVLDGSGRALMNAPYTPALIGHNYTSTLEHVRTAVRTRRPAVSQVIDSLSLHAPVVALAVPYAVPSGWRIFTASLRVDGGTLTSLLQSSVGIQTSAIYLVDRDNHLIADSTPMQAAVTPLAGKAPDLAAALSRRQSGTVSVGHRSSFFASAPVADADWRLITVVGTAALYASLASGATSLWLLAGTLWIAVLLAATWYGVSAHRRQRVREMLVRERETAQAHARLQQIIELLPAGLVLYDAEANRTQMNAVATRLLGPDLAGTPLRADYHALRHADGTLYTYEELPVVRALRSGAVVADQALLTNLTTGVETPVIVGSGPLRAADGSIQGVMAVMQDISALVALERQRDRMLATVAHDLRNPLTSIAGMSQLLQLRMSRVEEPAREKFAHSLRTIESAARRMTAQISELLDFAQAQTGKQIGLALESTDVVALLRGILSEHQQSTDEHRLELRAEEESIVAEVDAQRLERAVANLLVNAIKYSPQGGPIVVSVARAVGPDGRWLSIDVADSGLGIPAADLPHMFEQYYRASNVANTIPGTGIGLAGVRHMVERHGGTAARSASTAPKAWARR